MQKDTLTVWEGLKDNLYRFILKRVKHQVEAEDILQEVFIKIHLNLANLANHSNVQAWAYQITRNQIVDYYKKTRHAVELQDTTLEKLPEPERKIMYCCFESFIHELPQKYRKVIELINFEGKKQQEVAELLGVSLANTKSRVLRAKEMLKKKFVTCCQFTIDEHGKLTGEQNCQRCGFES
jgi:RNA polymerase sigma-70 factor (ECF subfamily)